MSRVINPTIRFNDLLTEGLALMTNLPDRLADVMNTPTKEVSNDEDDGKHLEFDYWIYWGALGEKLIQICPYSYEFSRKLFGAMQMAGWGKPEIVKNSYGNDMKATWTHLGTGWRIMVDDYRPATCKLVTKQVKKIVEATPARPARDAQPEREEWIEETVLECEGGQTEDVREEVEA